MPTFEARNPHVWKLPEMREFTLRAFNKSPWPAQKIHDFLSTLSTLPSFSTILNAEQGVILGMSLVALPTSPFDDKPQIFHFYSEGSARDRRVLAQATMDFIQQAGYTSAWAVNYTGKPDPVWERTMKTSGWEIRPIGSIMEFKAK